MSQDLTVMFFRIEACGAIAEHLPFCEELLMNFQACNQADLSVVDRLAIIIGRDLLFCSLVLAHRFNIVF
jgi:hypothetical protein